MRWPRKIKHEFVEFIPRDREEGVLYVSIPYATAVHNCFCGCGQKVVTPISPTGWRLMFDGETVSLAPSVGNWSYPCRSHYIIRNDKAVWSGDMLDADIAHDRARDKAARERHCDGIAPEPTAAAAPPAKPPRRKLKMPGWLRKVTGLDKD